MAWILLGLAGLLEVVWAVGLKATAGLTRFWPSLLTLSAMAASLALLSQALKSLPIGTAYAVWTGIGAAGTALYGMAFGGESADWPRLFCLGLIVAGIVGLKWTSG
jgi:quaternary ammonium compound-resistance protein SugE